MRQGMLRNRIGACRKAVGAPAWRWHGSEKSGAPDTDRTCDLSLHPAMAFATGIAVCSLDYAFTMMRRGCDARQVGAV